MAVVRRVSFSSFIFLCFHLLAPLCRTSDAVGSAMIEAINCSTSGNYTPASAYAANLNRFLAALPENAVSKNGGFFNGTVGEGTATVYGLAMCSADYSRADCSDCLAATASSNTGGLPNRCPGSTTVLAVFDRCLIRYSDTNFLGTAEIDIIYSSSGAEPSSAMAYSGKMKDILQLLTSEAVASPQRFAASANPPYALMQCTWDLPPDKCKQCLDVLSANASDWWSITLEGKRKSYSCTVRYSNTSFMVLPFSNGASSGPLQPTSSIDQTAASAAASRAQGSHTVAMVVGSVIAIVVTALLAYLLWHVYRSRCLPKTQVGDVKPADETQVEDVKPADQTQVFVPRSFTYEELAHATSDFAERKKLGEGGFGVVYEGTLSGIEETVAVKKIKTDTWSEDPAKKDQAKKDFYNEIRTMSKLHHRNILSLLGWCEEGDNLLLIYEIMKNGNLEDQLYPKNGATDARVYGVTYSGTSLQLDWPKRHNILIGIAAGLAYLHNECPHKSIVHRDIKPGNVMLDATFNAKLSDFGLVTQVNHTQTSRETNNVIGTRSYMDPLYLNTGKISGQSDVYSLGVMLLEIVCGEKPIIMPDEKNSLIEKVRRCKENGKILEAADTELRGGRFDEDIKRVLEIGLNCVHQDRHWRPHTRRVRDLLMELKGPLPAVSASNPNPSRANGRGQRSEDEHGRCPNELSTRAKEDAGVASLLQRRPTL